MTSLRIDLNGDVGEGAAGDAELIPLLTSVNIACGGHAGGASSMTEAVERALAAGANIGAHPSYPDRDHFGRVEMVASPAEVRAWMQDQVGQLCAVVAAKGARLRHVKPHGALYNAAAKNIELAAAIATAVAEMDPSLVLVALAGSELERAGVSAGLRVAREGFLDRAYLRDGTLAPRDQPGAVIDDAAKALAQAIQLIRGEEIAALNGGVVRVHIDTLCVHSDSPGAVELARSARQVFAREGITIAPF